jgi:hypothetical protein
MTDRVEVKTGVERPVGIAQSQEGSAASVTAMSALNTAIGNGAVNAIVMVQIADGSYHVEWQGYDAALLALFVSAKAVLKKELFDKLIKEV